MVREKAAVDDRGAHHYAGARCLCWAIASGPRIRWTALAAVEESDDEIITTTCSSISLAEIAVFLRICAVRSHN